MKPQWNNLSKTIDEYADCFQELYDNTTDRKISKNLKVLASTLNKILALRDEFGKLVDPIAPRAVDLPYQTPEFSEEWLFYKEYLMEQHQTYIPSRTEIKMLKKLKVWSRNNEMRALEIIEFLIINRYRSFFKPTERQLSGEEIPVEELSNATSANLNVDKSNRV